jgi:hypothetical protein
MTIFNSTTMDTIEGAVKTLAGKIYTSQALMLTNEEFIEAFIDPEHRAILKTTAELVGSVGGDIGTGIQLLSPKGSLRTMAHYSGGAPIIVPLYVGKSGVGRWANPELAERITSWVSERIRIGMLFGSAIDALRWLNNSVGNAGAMKVMFPAFPAVLAYAASDKVADPNGLYIEDDRLAKRALNIANAKAFRTLPKLPPNVRNQIADVSALLLTATLMEGGADVLEGIPHKGAAIMSVGLADTNETHKNFITGGTPTFV